MPAEELLRSLRNNNNSTAQPSSDDENPKQSKLLRSVSLLEDVLKE